MVFIGCFGAGDGNRTRVTSLEGWDSTIELHPHIIAFFTCFIFTSQNKKSFYDKAFIKIGFCNLTHQIFLLAEAYEDKKKLLQDIFGRSFPYLRLSITDACNFRCRYCLPNGYAHSGKQQFLTVDEIGRLVRGFAALGVWKIRLTGGEPTIRNDLPHIIEAIRSIPQITHIALTTNGYNLLQKAFLYYEAGVHYLNVSVDSLDPKKFQEITGQDKLSEIMEGIYLAKKIGFQKIKINAVLMKGYNDQDISQFIEWVRHRSFSIRFIELMETGHTKEFFQKHHVSGQVVEDFLLNSSWREIPRALAAGPAREFLHPDFQGTIGLITPYGKNFCASCNRLRVSAKGGLQLCLFGDGRHDLRPLLQHDTQLSALQKAIIGALNLKEEAHRLQQGHTGITPHLASIGG